MINPLRFLFFSNSGMPPGHLEWRRLGRILMDWARYYQSQISPNTQSHLRITEALIGFSAPTFLNSASSVFHFIFSTYVTAPFSHDALLYSREESSGYLWCMLLRDEGPKLLHGCPSSTHGNHVFHTCRCEQRHGCLLEGLKRLRRESRIPQGGFAAVFISTFFIGSMQLSTSFPHLIWGRRAFILFLGSWIESRLSLPVA